MTIHSLIAKKLLSTFLDSSIYIRWIETSLKPIATHSMCTISQSKRWWSSHYLRYEFHVQVETNTGEIWAIHQKQENWSKSKNKKTRETILSYHGAKWISKEMRRSPRVIKMEANLFLGKIWVIHQKQQENWSKSKNKNARVTIVH